MNGIKYSPMMTLVDFRLREIKSRGQNGIFHTLSPRLIIDTVTFRCKNGVRVTYRLERSACVVNHNVEKTTIERGCTGRVAIENNRIIGIQLIKPEEL